MAAILGFGILLLVAVLLSGLAHRSLLSTAVVFLGAGFALGPGGLDLAGRIGEPVVVTAIANVALFVVLFTDGMRTGVHELRMAWRLPGRALLFGMPLTVAITAVMAHWITNLPWSYALLLGAVLAPTDPVFASAIVGRPEVPRRLRRLLQVESGLNDALALPLVLVFLDVTTKHQPDPLIIAVDLLEGIGIGVVVPLVAISLLALPTPRATPAYRPLAAFGIGLSVFATAGLIHGNLYLAGFTAGVTIASVRPIVRRAYEHVGEPFAEIAKLLALLVFGALLERSTFTSGGHLVYLFAALVLLVARPLALLVSFLGHDLPWREQITAMWFGPKGFASVIFAILVLDSGTPRAIEVFRHAAVVTVISILVHTTSDSPIARWLARPHPPRAGAGGG